MIENNKKTDAVELEAMTTEEEDDLLAEVRAMDDEEVSALQATVEFIGRNPIYFNPRPNEGGYPKYSPRHDSVYRYVENQDGYTVHYSYPKDYKTVVASFWTQYEGEDGKTHFSLQHINLTKLMKPILAYNKSRGYLPPPPRNSVPVIETKDDF
jgi:hypothetical protein